MAGDRRALAKAITLLESVRPQDEEAAESFLAAVTAGNRTAFRLGLSGAPGVGKSTFIEAFGLYLADQGLKLAVLAVDPSSQRSGGSILGDKTRMPGLSRHANAFIRPSPAGRALGGVARRTQAVVAAVEAAGFDLVLVETVGVGQSETAVAAMTDMFMLLMAPGAGDDLQGIKRGIMELADLIVITKADGDLVPAARRAQADFASAVHWLRPRVPGWQTQVLSVSALEGAGLPAVWAAAQAFRDTLLASGEGARNRAEQRLAWAWSEVQERLLMRRHGPEGAAAIGAIEERVRQGALDPLAAARKILAVLDPRYASSSS